VATTGFRPPISAFIAHPVRPVREHLEDELAGTGVTVVGRAETGPEALDQILRLAPDVAVVAADLPELDGPGVCRSVRPELPACRILLVADHDDDHSFEGLLAGAYGCYLLNQPSMRFLHAVRGTMRREALPTPGWASRMLTRYDELEAVEATRLVPIPRLTPTEREVLQRLRDGETPQAIADRHTVSVHSVRIHASYAIIKLTRAIADEAVAASA
jgi:DNA-binding NarL/FixJ family response regulator